MIERLYWAYFTEQRSVFDRAVLVDRAAEAGAGADAIPMINPRPACCQPPPMP